jgi:hypothetical protein
MQTDRAAHGKSRAVAAKEFVTRDANTLFPLFFNPGNSPAIRAASGALQDGISIA